MSKSDSSQRSETQTANYDNRVANEGQGIAIGAGGSYVNNLSQGSVDLITNVLDFTGDALNSVASVYKDSNKNEIGLSEKLVDSNRDLQSQQQLGSASLIKDIVPVLVIGAIGIVMFIALRRK